MRMTKALALACVLGPLLTAAAARAEPPPNKVLGTWRMVSAQIEQNGDSRPAYGPRPNGMLVFTPDMNFVEVLTDATLPRFASDVRGKGTAQENQAAMAGGIGFFGTYTVDEKGEFSGNRVDGSTFPNWVGSVRTSRQLRLVVEGDRMTEYFQRPEGARVYIEWERVHAPR